VKEGGNDGSNTFVDCGGNEHLGCIRRQIDRREERPVERDSGYGAVGLVFCVPFSVDCRISGVFVHAEQI